MVNPIPTPTSNNTGPYCAGAPIQLNSPTGSATDDWTGPSAYVANNIQNPTIPVSTVAMSGDYTVTVTTAAGQLVNGGLFVAPPAGTGFTNCKSIDFIAIVCERN